MLGRARGSHAPQAGGRGRWHGRPSSLGLSPSPWQRQTINLNCGCSSAVQPWALHPRSGTFQKPLRHVPFPTQHPLPTAPEVLICISEDLRVTT